MKQWRRSSLFASLQTPVYNICRSLGLLDALPPTPSKRATDLPLGTRLRIAGLRFLSAMFAVLMACGYPILGLLYNTLPELWDEPLLLRVLRCFAAAVPYSLLTHQILSDMISGYTSNDVHCNLTLYLSEPF